MANLLNLTVNDTGFLGLPSGTTDQRPGSPLTGYIRFNTTFGVTEYYNGTYWIDPTTGKISEGSIIITNLLLNLDAVHTLYIGLIQPIVVDLVVKQTVIFLIMLGHILQVHGMVQRVERM